MKENTAQRLKELMKERQLRQTDILKLSLPYCQKYDVKLTKQDLSQYLSGYTEPGQQKLMVLSMALNVNPTWLMGWDVPKEYGVATICDHKELSYILYALRIIALESGYELSYFANKVELKYNNTSTTLSPKDVDNYIKSAIEQIEFVSKCTFLNRLREDKFLLHEDNNYNISYSQQHNILNAAHALPNTADEDKLYDDDIMDDDDF